MSRMAVSNYVRHSLFERRNLTCLSMAIVVTMLSSITSWDVCPSRIKFKSSARRRGAWTSSGTRSHRPTYCDDHFRSGNRLGQPCPGPSLLKKQRKDLKMKKLKYRTRHARQVGARLFHFRTAWCWMSPQYRSRFGAAGEAAIPAGYSQRQRHRSTI